MSLLPVNYNQVIFTLKEKIRNARLKAVLTANAQLLEVYWEIGKVIAEQEQLEGWGAKTIDRLSADLKMEFEDMRGFSPRNLRYMRDFYLAYPYPAIWQQVVAKTEKPENELSAIWQQAVAKLPWGHHTVIITNAKTQEERAFYIQKCLENNWSRSVLAIQIEKELFNRTGTSINNFSATLPAPQSDLAVATFKNPYLFDFFGMSEKMRERDLEQALVTHLKKFMLELGKGFAYVGNQFKLNVNEDEYFLDLLFYNTLLHCYVVFELKIGEFKPEFAGKLNFYINAIDAEIKDKQDAPTIGILLCTTPNETVVKYALQGIQTPMGISEFQLADALPKELNAEMPTVEELEKEIEEGYEELKTPAQKRIEALKEKLAGLKGSEIKQIATTPILFEIIDKSLIPLYQLLIKRMEDFAEMFYSTNHSWYSQNTSFTDIQQLAAFWRDEMELKKSAEYFFQYRLEGFKKGGPDAFNISFQLNFRIDKYWYGFTLINYNSQQPFLKKLYGEQLTPEDMQTIVDIVSDQLTERIDWSVDQIINKQS